MKLFSIAMTLSFLTLPIFAGWFAEDGPDFVVDQMIGVTHDQLILKKGIPDKSTELSDGSTVFDYYEDYTGMRFNINVNTSRRQNTPIVYDNDYEDRISYVLKDLIVVSVIKNGEERDSLTMREEKKKAFIQNKEMNEKKTLRRKEVYVNKKKKGLRE